MAAKQTANTGRDGGHIIPEGQRNKTLTSIAGRMRRRGASEDEMLAELRSINGRWCNPPLPDAELCKIAASIARYDPTAKPDERQSLQDFIRAAINKNGLDFACRSKWRSPLFAFARLLKGRAELDAMDGYRAAQVLDTVLAELSHEPDPWHGIFGDISDGPRVELMKTWATVQTTAGGDPLTIARDAAHAFPLKPLRTYSGKYAEFISLTGHLQHTHPGQRIAVPLERIGELLKCHHTMVGVYRRWAQNDGLLTKVAEYTAHQRAAEFYFQVDQFDWATGEQHGSLSPEHPLTRDSVPHSRHTHHIHHGLVRVAIAAPRTPPLSLLV